MERSFEKLEEANEIRERIERQQASGEAADADIDGLDHLVKFAEAADALQRLSSAQVREELESFMRLDQGATGAGCGAAVLLRRTSG